MPIAPALRRLDIELPACPRSLVELALLLDDEGMSLARVATLIEADMALAAAVVRSVNSAHFGLLRRVGTVNEALQHLGFREVCALTYAIGLRGAFPPSPFLESLWNRASRRGRAMGACAAALGIDPWQAHTTGLFGEVGAAALHRHDPVASAELMAERSEPLQRTAAEIARFGVSHAALGGALCQVWGLAAPVAEAVRQRPLAHALAHAEDADQAAALRADWEHEPPPLRRLLALLAAADLAPSLDAPPAAGLDAEDFAAEARWMAACERLAREAGLDAGLLIAELGRALVCLDVQGTPA
ncbi:HDOD domain-containing protein [Piscinibacter sp. Jin2]|uniref:HDOD domain-containing protein n=1 Tax=Aquariibacter lacus TaxID=2801332 RepID=A0A9X0XD19_9BURK|nr:HDOD domain-containing protein [Piscinibacter lacus]MBL0718522.1 HDOD domain-containing protein [Piscinibacter lacus]